MALKNVGHPALETLGQFFVAMNEWGNELLDHHRSLDWDGNNVDLEELAGDRARQRKKLEAIFIERLSENAPLCHDADAT